MHITVYIQSSSRIVRKTSISLDSMYRSHQHNKKCLIELPVSEVNNT